MATSTVTLQRTLLREFCTRAVPHAVFALTLLCNSAADAQSASTLAQPPQTPVSEEPSTSVSPQPLASNPSNAQWRAQSVKQAQLIAARHSPVNCDLYLSPGTIIPRDVLATRISFRLALDGSLHDVALYRSSGNSGLDKAALACAGAAFVLAIDSSGNQIEINWIGAISWNYFRHNVIEPDPSSEVPHICYGRYPLRAMWLRAQGDALVSYHIATDGSVKDATITESAGHESLDQASLDCVSAWHFFRATHDGTPIEIDRQSVIRWRVGRR